MVDGRRSLWLNVLVYGLILLKTEGFNIGITYVETAVAIGAVCLDGSPPAYHLDKGFGAGINNWLVHIEGGGWCNNVADCLSRSNNRLGSSKYMDKEVAFSGMLSNEQKFNPDFYNWNRIKVRYCDGASFTGDVEAVNPATNLHFRGARVFLAIIEDLLAKGMKNAQNAILSGCSAGGLASILHCDKFRTLIPIGAKVKCLSDAGYFIHIKDVSGGQRIQTFYNEVGSSKNLPESCTSRLNPALIKNILVPSVADPHGTWDSCKLDINNCSSSQLQIMQSFRLQFLNAVSELGSSTSRGLFIDSCYSHCQTGMQEIWLSADSPVLGNTLLEIGVCIVMDWSFVHKAWEKWASLSVGSSGEPLKAALLINYDPTGPSRLLSTLYEALDLKVDFGACSAEQEGLKADPIEMTRFVDFIQQNKLQTGSFIIGSNEYMVTSIHENWFCARCMNTLQPSGEGAIVMQTKAFILVALYEGSIGPASRAMLSVDQLAWHNFYSGFRLQFLNAVSGLGNSTSRGLFIDSCYAHCQTEMQETWLRADSPVLGKTTIAKAVGGWYYDRSAFQKIDCPYPCNHQIYHSV
ncbi:hypothetical protein EZV62_019854 [Acer yangbiense]|uniref:Pectin acetylesterase n=1 Tax=Acer yangbiense TaxID=1000413 RepID=A0A5C7HCK9_9ROSI|nr:hypothetical protein EZV62_019854 [Acer yangbiense]